jgi:hypothetical protein
MKERRIPLFVNLIVTEVGDIVVIGRMFNWTV